MHLLVTPSFNGDNRFKSRVADMIVHIALQSVMKGEGEQQMPVHFYHTLEPTVVS